MTDLDAISVIVRERNGQRYLVAADMHAEEIIARFKLGKEILVSMRSPRNAKHHRKFFWLLQFVIDNTEGRWNDKEELLTALKFATGHTVKTRRWIEGGEIEYAEIPASIDFASMSQEEFNVFYEKCLPFVADELGVHVEVLRKMIAEMTEDRRHERD